MRRTVISFLTGLFLLPLLGWICFRYGYVAVATAAPPMPFERQLAHLALHAHIRKEAPADSPLQADDENFLAGAHVYRNECASCHGLPGQAAFPMAKGMFPRPPQLFKGHGVTDDPVGETYWKVANGIRLTGMPAYRDSLSEKEQWQVSLLLANADKLPQPIRAGLEQPLSTN